MQGGFYVFFILAAGAFLAGLMINSILRQSVNELLRESEEIDHTGFAFFKQMKLKYENYMRTGREINNTEAFAGKYLDKYRCHGIRIHSYEKASMCASGLCVIFGACGALLDKSHALEYLLVGFLAMYVVTGSRHLIDVAGKRRRITTDLVDFLKTGFRQRQPRLSAKRHQSEKLTSRYEKGLMIWASV